VLRLAIVFAWIVALGVHCNVGEASNANDSSQLVAELQSVKRELHFATQFQSDMLATVHWSLGTVAGIAVLLVGWGWWSNFRVYERDRETLLKDLTSTVTTLVAAHERANAMALGEERTQRNAAMESVKSELKNYIDQHLTTQLAALGTNVNSQIEEVDAELGMRIDWLELTTARSARRLAEEAGRYSAVLTHTLDELECGSRLGTDYFVVTTLEAIVESLDRGGKLTETEIQRLTSLLDKTSEAGRPVAKKILQRLASSDVAWRPSP